MAASSELIPGRFVRVRVAANKYQVGVIDSVDVVAQTASVSTNGGFAVSAKLADIRRAILVIVDLNGVLGCRGATSKSPFIKRPHIDDFLAFLFRNFVVAVWTSSMEANGRRIIEEVFGPRYGPKLCFTWFRDKCTKQSEAAVAAGSSSNPYGTIKDLTTVWTAFPSFDSRNTVIVDDSRDKCSHPSNSVCPSQFIGEGEQIIADEGLLHATTLLTEVLERNSLLPVTSQAVILGAPAARILALDAPDGDGGGKTSPGGRVMVGMGAAAAPPPAADSSARQSPPVSRVVRPARDPYATSPPPTAAADSTAQPGGGFLFPLANPSTGGFGSSKQSPSNELSRLVGPFPTTPVVLAPPTTPPLTGGLPVASAKPPAPRATVQPATNAVCTAPPAASAKPVAGAPPTEGYDFSKLLSRLPSSAIHVSSAATVTGPPMRGPPVAATNPGAVHLAESGSGGGIQVSSLLRRLSPSAGLVGAAGCATSSGSKHSDPVAAKLATQRPATFAIPAPRTVADVDAPPAAGRAPAPRTQEEVVFTGNIADYLAKKGVRTAPMSVNAAH